MHIEKYGKVDFLLLLLLNQGLLSMHFLCPEMHASVL